MSWRHPASAPDVLVALVDHAATQLVRLVADVQALQPAADAPLLVPAQPSESELRYTANQLKQLDVRKALRCRTNSIASV